MRGDAQPRPPRPAPDAGRHWLASRSLASLRLASRKEAGAADDGYRRGAVGPGGDGTGALRGERACPNVRDTPARQVATRVGLWSEGWAGLARPRWTVASWLEGLVGAHGPAAERARDRPARNRGPRVALRGAEPARFCRGRTGRRGRGPGRGVFRGPSWLLASGRAQSAGSLCEVRSWGLRSRKKGENCDNLKSFLSGREVRKEAE